MPLWIIISFLVLSAFCIFSIAKLFGRGEKEYAKSALSTYAFYTILFFVMWIFKLSMPSFIILLSMITVLIACFIGHYLRYYTQSKTFDRYLHAFGSFSFSLLTYFILSNIMDTHASKLFQGIFIFLTGNTLGVFFELIEAKHDRKAVTKSQKGLKDTDMDMLFNLIGSGISGIFACFWLL